MSVNLHDSLNPISTPQQEPNVQQKQKELSTPVSLNDQVLHVKNSSPSRTTPRDSIHAFEGQEDNGLDLERLAESVKDTSPRERATEQTAKKTNKFFNFFKVRSTFEEIRSVDRKFDSIGQGKAKRVWRLVGKEGYVFYTPVKGVFSFLKKWEIQKEVNTAKEIRKELLLEKAKNFNEPKIHGLIDKLIKSNVNFEKLSNEDSARLALKNKGFSEGDTDILIRFFQQLDTPINQIGKNIALDLREVKESKRKESDYTVKAPIASGDLESVLNYNFAGRQLDAKAEAAKSDIMDIIRHNYIGRSEDYEQDLDKADRLISNLINSPLDLSEKPTLEQLQAHFPEDAEFLSELLDLLQEKGHPIESFDIKSVKSLQDPVFTNENRRSYQLQFLQGMADLHKAGYLHGDMKPDNLLIYRDGKMKLTDFGKTTKAKVDDPLKYGIFYSGNPRFAAPEGRLSESSEVYSAGLILIKMLEAEFLTDEKNTLLEVKKENQDNIQPAVRKGIERSGIEKYLILHKDCPQSEVTSLRGKFRVYGRSVRQAVSKKPFDPKSESSQKTQKAVHAYIEELEARLKKTYPGKADRVDEITKLLKRMTDKEPLLRGTMEDALQDYVKITQASVS